MKKLITKLSYLSYLINLDINYINDGINYLFLLAAIKLIVNKLPFYLNLKLKMT